MLLIAVMWTLMSETPNQVYVRPRTEYAQLYEICENKAGRACCRASVHAIKKESAAPTTIQKGCTAPQWVRSLPCPASMVWCSSEPRPNTDPFKKYHDE